MDRYLRYVSVAALIVDKQRKRFLITVRSDSDSYEAGSVVFPSGRVEGNERLHERLLAEIKEEVDIAVDVDSVHYIGECMFLRDGVCVNQLCFGVVALQSVVPSQSKELKNIRWISPEEFYREFKPIRYAGELFTFVRKAQEIGFLRGEGFK